MDLCWDAATEEKEVRNPPEAMLRDPGDASATESSRITLPLREILSNPPEENVEIARKPPPLAFWAAIPGETPNSAPIRVVMPRF
jgi:hypothetical protein